MGTRRGQGQADDADTPRRAGLVGIGRVELDGVGYGAVFDRTTGRVAIAAPAVERAGDKPALAAAWIGSAVVRAGGELELGPRLVSHLRAIGVPLRVARASLVALLDARGLRRIGGATTTRTPTSSTSSTAPRRALRVTRWCDHCASALHDVDAHTNAEAAAIAAREHLEAHDEEGARMFAAHARLLLARSRRRDG